jgi:hypothetical protein
VGWSFAGSLAEGWWPNGGNAELRGEVAYLEGPATAANEYEVPPHDATRVERITGGRPQIPEDVPRSETSLRSVDWAADFARLAHMSERTIQHSRPERPGVAGAQRRYS